MTFGYIQSGKPVGGRGFAVGTTSTGFNGLLLAHQALADVIVLGANPISAGLKLVRVYLRCEAHKSLSPDTCRAQQSIERRCCHQRCIGEQRVVRPWLNPATAKWLG